MNATAASMNATESRKGYWAAFRQMPVALQAYAGFVCVAAAAWCAGLGILFWPAVDRYVAPYGNATTLSPYLFTIYFILSMPVFPRRRWLVFSLPALVSVALWTGIAEMSRWLSESDGSIATGTASWFLRYEPSRVLLGVVLPLFWIMMLVSPEVWRWTSSSRENSCQRLSVLDLFYLVFVCAVCIAVSIGLMSQVRERQDAFRAAVNRPMVSNSSPLPSPLTRPVQP